MTAIKHTLQREVFLPAEERLVGLVHVAKAGKKKKSSFLCAAVTVDSPVQAHIYQLKKADKGESYKKKLSWFLRELKVVDGKDVNKFSEIAEFDLHFEKVYKWVASSMTEKSSFISCLWRLSQRYHVQKADFLNIPKTLLEEVSRPSGQSQIAAGTDDIAMVDEDYQALSSKEEADLELLMSECQMAISNAEAFSEQLSKQLSMLDGNVKDQMEVMKDKDILITLRNKNYEKLLHELDTLVSTLDLDIKHTRALMDGDLLTPTGIYECTAAAEALQKCVHANIHPVKSYGISALKRIQNDETMIIKQADEGGAIVIMDVEYYKDLVEEQLNDTTFYCEIPSNIDHHIMKKINHLVSKHYNSLTDNERDYITNFEPKPNFFLSVFLIFITILLIVLQGNEMGETLSRFANELKLPQHHSSHRDLTPYADLMLWLKNANFNSFVKLSKVYTESLSKLYNKEIQDFLECAKQRLVGKGEKGKLNQKTSSSSSLTKMADRGRSSSIQSVDSVTFSKDGSDLDLSSRQLFDQILDKVLSELEPVCLAEQHFTVRFFHLADNCTLEQKTSSEDESDPGAVKKTNEDYFVENLGEGLYQKRSTVQVRQINEEMRRMMTDLFPSLETELENFITFADKLDGCNSMYMLVRMSQHVINTQDAGSFLSMTFANCLVKTKRNFDRFIQNKITAIKESKISKKNKCGIINFVSDFDEFAKQAEIIFKGSDRRADLEKAYCKLVHTISDEIVRVAKEHQKTPEHVIYMENYHRMNSILSRLKISCLESEKKDFKQKYLESLHKYTTSLLGRPLEKIHIFFEGVESRVAAGVKMEEVGYQLAFSKQELRKVIKEYPGKEVKKGLEHLYRKVEKHLCEEENLFEVVWHTMQDEFIRAYKHYENLINNCYPDSLISLEFSMADVLEYFSNIARLH
ncbi:exocyst complex component 1 [Octopus bimaculoides]|uniref:exocyst complex component 1 n=1 Tax=Octopus bimaculoides TaxID=37653 RepID=UPI0022E139D0|nr:exocyst complex component 1 [Octopus bimaculoides]